MKELSFYNAIILCVLVFFVFCFVFWGDFVPLKNFSLIWRRHHYGEGQQILTYARHWWPLSSEDSLACQTYCDTGYLFITLTPIADVKQWSCHYLGLSRIRTANLPLGGERSNPPPRWIVFDFLYWWNSECNIYYELSFYISGNVLQNSFSW